MEEQPKRRLWGYVLRFSVVHVVTYVAAGITFMTLQNYAEAFATQEQFENYRPLDSPIVRAAPLLQFLRGAFLALVLYPFYGVIMKDRWGWLKLFAVLWGLTFLGAVVPIPGSIEGIIYTEVPLREHLIGIPEVTVQMLLFAGLFFWWERRVLRK